MAALWPARAGTRRAYAQSLAQRNALISRIRGGRASRASLASWDAQLAAHGIALMHDRARALDTIAEPFARLGTRLGLTGDPELRYRPRSRAAEPAELVAELAERIDSDLERGFTGHGPHRDDVSLLLHRAASCAPTGRRVSSGWRCWRCCWPSARRSPPAGMSRP